MALERSHGKARPTLPRAADLPQVQAVGEPRGSRGKGGRFAPGNQVGKGRGFKALVRKGLGAHASGPQVDQADRDARTHYSAFLRELPFSGDSVATLVKTRACWTAVLPQLMAKALAAGVDTKAGRELLELAMRVDQRCERLAVTSLDIAQRLAEAERQRNPARLPWLDAAGADVDDDEPEDAEQSDAPESRPEASTRELDPMRPERTDAE